MQMAEELNMSYVKEVVESCCRGEAVCEACMGKNCLIGFAKIVSDYATVKKKLVIPNGLTLVPTQDFKVYENDDIACALAAINLECKNCMDNHDDNCVINITRSSLEIALLWQHVEFTGSSLAYIMTLTQISPELGNQVMQQYNTLKNI